MARKHHPEIKIVWARWLNDSLALWERQDEGPYLLEPEPSGGASGSGALASPPSDSQQISSDPDPDADDWDGHLDIGRRGRALGALGVEGPRGGGEDGEELELDEVDWDAINNEVDAAMNESDDDGDDEEGEGDGVSVKSGMSEDDASWTDESNSIIRWVPPPHLPCAIYSHDVNYNDILRLQQYDILTTAEAETRAEPHAVGNRLTERLRLGRAPFPACEAQEARGGPGLAAQGGVHCRADACRQVTEG